MRRRLRRHAVALAACLVAGPAAADEYDPFKISAAQFRAQVRRVALAPTELPTTTFEPARVRAELDALLTEGLARHGLAVVPAAEFDATWRRFAADLGGVFDPTNGDADPEKYGTVWQHTVRELERRLLVDAVLTSNVHLDEVTAWHDPGSWTEHESFKALDTLLTWQGQPLTVSPQRVEGTYLSIEFVDRSQVTLYSVRVPIEWVRVYALGGIEIRKPEALHRDAARNRRVVEILLEDLSEAPTP